MAAKRILAPVGFYRLSMQTGLSTGIVATALMFAFRWGSTTKLAAIQRIKARWQTVTAFTAAQELSFSIARGTAYTATHTGGTPATLTAPNLKKETRFPATALTDARIGTTGGLAGGTITLDAMELGRLLLWSQAGAAPNVLNAETIIEPDVNSDSVLVLAQDEGFVVRCDVTMGAAGTGRMLVEVDWAEILK